MTSHVDCDVLVVGGGPAGAACATVLARNGMDVSVVDASTVESFRVGETISAAARPVFERIGLDLDHEPWAHVCDPVVVAWGDDSSAETPDILAPRFASWCVDRCALDRALLEGAKKVGTSVRLGCRVRTASRVGNRWWLTFVANGRQFAGSARFVVEATGRCGRSPCAPHEQRIVFDALVGLAMVGQREGRGRLGAALVESGPHGWWYSTSLPAGRELAVFLTDVQLLPADHKIIPSWLALQMSLSPLTQQRWMAMFGKRAMLSPVRVCDARSSVRKTVVADGWAATGDALMAFDPLTGRGVTEAIRSGIEVAEWLVDGGDLVKDSVPAWTCRASLRLTRYLAERVHVYSRESRWPQNEFWRRRRAS